MSKATLTYMQNHSDMRVKPKTLPNWIHRTKTTTMQLGSADMLHNKSKNCLAVALSMPLQVAVTQSGIKLDASKKQHWDNIPLNEMLLRLETLAKLTGNANFALQFAQPQQIGWKEGNDYSVTFPTSTQVEGLIQYKLWVNDTPIMHYAYFKGGKLHETGPKPETRNAFNSMKAHFETMKPRELFYPSAEKGRVAVILLPLITPQLILNYWLVSDALLGKLQGQAKSASAVKPIDRPDTLLLMRVLVRERRYSSRYQQQERITDANHDNVQNGF